MPEAVKAEETQRLVQAMSALSKAMWRTYTHPPEAAESLEANTEGWRRAETRFVLPQVPDIMLNPNLPRNGHIVTCYDPVEECAHQVGRALHAISEASVLEAVLRETRIELDAIEQAGLGNLTGRAAHAVTLTRAGASPVQIAAADELLRKDPLGGAELFTDVDPAASAVAAAHWLQAAADITARVSGIRPTGIVREADNIEALPHETPTAVLELMAEGLSPYEAVTYLLNEAMSVAKGRIYDVDGLQSRFEEMEELAAQHIDRDPNLREVLLAEVRLTTLDPARPAQDLLEDLLYGIHGCRLIYQEYDTDETDTSDVETDDDQDEAYYDELEERTDEAFLSALRAEAQATAERLN